MVSSLLRYQPKRMSAVHYFGKLVGLRTFLHFFRILRIIQQDNELEEGATTQKKHKIRDKNKNMNFKIIIKLIFFLLFTFEKRMRNGA